LIARPNGAFASGSLKSFAAAGLDANQGGDGGRFNAGGAAGIVE
jgi:hypothetical protein